jgi:hypothetical protein
VGRKVFTKCHAIREEFGEMWLRGRVKRGLAIGYFDGGSSSNPGPGAAAWALEYPDRTTMTGVKGLGVVTNNEAEYVALIDLM